MSSSAICDTLIIVLWALYLSISGVVILITENLYFKTLSIVVFAVLSVLAVLWLMVMLIALLVSCVLRLGLSEMIQIGADISKQFETKFLDLDFDQWETEKLRIEKRIRNDIIQVLFLVDIIKLQKDIDRVSRFLYFWNEVWIRVDIIVDAMSEAKWNENKLTVERYLSVVEALRQLDHIFRNSEYCRDPFELLSQAMVQQRHNRELEDIKRRVVSENRKSSQIYKSFFKSIEKFEQKSK